MYASIFVLVNATYIALCFEAVDRRVSDEVPRRMPRVMRLRSVTTLAVFAAEGVLAIWSPRGGFGLIVVCLLVYLRPDVAAAGD